MTTTEQRTNREERLAAARRDLKTYKGAYRELKPLSVTGSVVWAVIFGVPAARVLQVHAGLSGWIVGAVLAVLALGGVCAAIGSLIQRHEMDEEHRAALDAMRREYHTAQSRVRGLEGKRPHPVAAAFGKTFVVFLGLGAMVGFLYATHLGHTFGLLVILAMIAGIAALWTSVSESVKRDD